MPYKLKDVTVIKHHANSWGLSSNNYFGDEILTKTTKLKKLDMSETINYQVRSDMCMSVQSMLGHCSNLTEINLANNVLEEDGVRAVKEFLWVNTSLKVLNLYNTRL